MQRLPAAITPLTSHRTYSARLQQRAMETEFQIASMDDQQVLGPVLNHLTFGQAIENDPPLLTDYSVLVVGVNDALVRAQVEKSFRGNTERVIGRCKVAGDSDWFIQAQHGLQSKKSHLVPRSRQVLFRLSSTGLPKILKCGRVSILQYCVFFICWHNKLIVNR